jgi:hypothetical protein
LQLLHHHLPQLIWFRHFNIHPVLEDVHYQLARVLGVSADMPRFSLPRLKPPAPEGRLY